ncbi:MAG: hypothetical protein ACLQOO_28080 [Terriglobia bacterium]
MNTLDAKEAGEKLDRILNEAASAHQAVLITSLRASAVTEDKKDYELVQQF